MTVLLPGMLTVAAAVMLGRAGVHHLRDRAGFSQVLGGQGLWGSRSSRAIVAGLPPIEIVVSVLTLTLLAGRGSRALTAVALITLGSLFAVVIGRLMGSPSASCGCGPRREPVGPATLLRPLVLLGAGAVVGLGADITLSGPAAEQIVIVTAGIATALLVDLVVATAVSPRPMMAP